MTVEELRAKLQTNTYTPKTEQQIQEEAQARYKGTYDQQRLSAQQGYDTTAQALKNQLSTLGTAYDRQMQEAQKATDLAISAADRRSLGRGMQRSSYNAATLGNIALKGNKTLADIQADRTAAENDIAERQALASQQLQERLANLDNTYAADVQAAIDALKEQELARQNEADQYNNNLLLQLYELQETEKANDAALQLQEEKLRAARLENDLAELAAGRTGAATGSGSGGGSSTGGGATGGGTNPQVGNVPPNATNPADNAAAMAFLNSLGGISSPAPSSGLLEQLTAGIKNSTTPSAKKNQNTVPKTSGKGDRTTLAASRNGREVRTAVWR